MSAVNQFLRGTCCLVVWKWSYVVAVVVVGFPTPAVSSEKMTTEPSGVALSN